MFGVLEAALGELARAGASHGEARLVELEREASAVRFEEIERLQRNASRGIGVGRELAASPLRWTVGPGSVRCPALLVRDFRFTGRAG